MATWSSKTIYLMVICWIQLQGGLTKPQTTGIIDCEKTKFTAAYASYPPYVFQKKNGDVSGAITHVLREVVDECCGSNVSLSYTTLHISIRDIEEFSTGKQDLLLPVVRNSLSMVDGLLGYMYVPVLQTSGSVVLVKASTDEANPITETLTGCWPLAVLVIFSAGLAGILVWILDRYWNPEEFPKSFMYGCWEGTWWAYVTMTTVGYGDRAPKSIPARAFGLIWMFVGIVMMSIFTATLATAFTTTTSLVEIDFKGAKISVIKGSIEQILAYKEGADVSAYTNFRDALELVSNGTLEAALVDINYALYNYDNILSRGLTLGQKISNVASYGVVIYNQSTNVEQCLALKMTQKQFKVYDSMIRNINKLEKEHKSGASRTVESVFDGVITVIIVVVVLWAIAFIACVLWEIFYYRPSLRKQKNPTENGEQGSGCFKRQSSVSAINEDDQTLNDTETVKRTPEKEKDFLKQEDLFTKTSSPGLIEGNV